MDVLHFSKEKTIDLKNQIRKNSTVSNTSSSTSIGTFSDKSRDSDGSDNESIAGSQFPSSETSTHTSEGKGLRLLHKELAKMMEKDLGMKVFINKQDKRHNAYTR